MLNEMGNPEFQEIELKLRVRDEDTLDKILQDPQILKLCHEKPRVSHYDTTYYDTEKRALMKHQVAYRIRQFDGEYVATLKGFGSTKDGLAIRSEWNKKLESNTPTLQPFADLPIGQELIKATCGEELLPLFTTHFQRTAFDLTCEDNSVIELAADRGEIVAGDKRERICEIELELKSGAVENVMNIGRALITRYGLETEGKSKYLRGLILAGLV